jgi:hypothetical protein
MNSLEDQVDIPNQNVGGVRRLYNGASDSDVWRARNISQQ